MKASAYIITLAALAITACDNGINPPSGDLQPGQVDIHLAIAGNPVTSTRATIDPSTGEGTFNAGDILGMYTTAASEVIDANSIYKVDETVLFWSDLSTTNEVTFSAHYPRITETIEDPTAYKYDLTEHGAAGKDLLAATATAKKGSPVQLEFHHLMHRLIVKLKSGANMDGVDLSQAVIKTISASGKPTVAFSTYVNLITGTVGTAQKPIDMAYNANGTQADWIVVPQDLTPYEGFLEITIGDDTWHYNVPASLNQFNPSNPTRLESGQCLTLTLTLKKAGKNEIELTSSKITAWESQANMDGNINVDASITKEELSDALKGTGDEPIIIDGNLIASYNSSVELTSDRTLTVAPGATLTLNGSSSISTSNDHTLTINGGGTVIVEGTHYDLLTGNFDLENVTVLIRNSEMYGIEGYQINVNKDAVIELDSETGSNLLYLRDKGSINVNGGSIIVRNFFVKGIISLGTITINEGGTIELGKGRQKSDVSTAPQSLRMIDNDALLYIKGGSLTGSDGGTIYLKGKFKDQNGSVVNKSRLKGASGLFKNGDYVLDTDDEVIVDYTGTKNAIAGGFYTWNETDKMFVLTSLK